MRFDLTKGVTAKVSLNLWPHLGHDRLELELGPRVRVCKEENDLNNDTNTLGPSLRGSIS